MTQAAPGSALGEVSGPSQVVSLLTQWGSANGQSDQEAMGGAHAGAPLALAPRPFGRGGVNWLLPAHLPGGLTGRDPASGGCPATSSLGDPCGWGCLLAPGQGRLGGLGACPSGTFSRPLTALLFLASLKALLWGVLLFFLVNPHPRIFFH